MILIWFKCSISTLVWDSLNGIHYINFPIIGHKGRENIWRSIWSWGHSWRHGGNGLSRLHRVRDLGRAGEEGSGAASGKVGIPTSVCRLNEFISEHTKHC